MINGLVCSGVWQVSVSQMQTMVNMNVMNDGPWKMKENERCVCVCILHLYKGTKHKGTTPVRVL